MKIIISYIILSFFISGCGIHNRVHQKNLDAIEKIVESEVVEKELHDHMIEEIQLLSSNDNHDFNEENFEIVFNTDENMYMYVIGGDMVFERDGLRRRIEGRASGGFRMSKYDPKSEQTIERIAELAVTLQKKRQLRQEVRYILNSIDVLNFILDVEYDDMIQDHFYRIDDGERIDRSEIRRRAGLSSL